MPHRDRFTLSLVLTMIVHVLGVPPVAAVGPVGEPLRLDHEDACSGYVDLARLADGGFVAVWVQDVEQDPEPARRLGVHARLFDVDGTPRGPAFLVDAAEAADVDETPAVAAGGNGFLVAWLRSSSPLGGGGHEILARPHGSDGTPLGEVIELGPTVGTAVTGPVVDVAAEGDAYRVVWLTDTVHTRVVDATGDLGDTEILGAWPVGPSGGAAMRALAVASDPEGFSLVVERVLTGNVFGPHGSFLNGRGYAVGQEIGQTKILALSDPDRELEETVPAVGTDADGNTVVAWRSQAGAAAPRGIGVRLFATDGVASTGRIWVTGPGGWDSLTKPALAVADDGSFVVVWGGRRQGAVRAAVFAAAFDKAGRRLLPDWSLPFDPSLSPVSLDVLELDEGEALVAWHETLTTAPIPEPDCFSAGIRAQRIATGSGASLFLHDDRFAVQVKWQNPYAAGLESGTGVANHLNDESGWFWFFRPGNAELAVKVLDGRPVNGHWWVFHGGLSTVAYEITVTDLDSGATWSYDKPPFQRVSAADTTAFADDTGEPGGSAAPARPAPLTSVTVRTHPDSAAGPCTDPSLPVLVRPGLCLHGRFEVEAELDDPLLHRDFGGATLSPDTGRLWFFREDNTELLVKVLDGRPVNGHWWVFSGALTNVGYTLVVRDTESGEERHYPVPEGRFESIADTVAFSDPASTH